VWQRPVAIALVVLALSALVAAASPQSTPDPVPALLAEVRQLRIAIERSATVNPRIQLFTSRMALQDERVFRVARQVESLRDELDRLTTQGRESAARNKQFEEMLAGETDPQKRLELQETQRFTKIETELRAAREQLLRTREAEAANALAAEQARWMELSQKLDELERMLDNR
jgi:septal ring factor EnvC (AmiA/AmiB activator)